MRTTADLFSVSILIETLDCVSTSEQGIKEGL